MPIIKQIELINKKKFIKTVLDKNSEIFVKYVAVLETSKMTIYLLQTAQIISKKYIQASCHFKAEQKSLNQIFTPFGYFSKKEILMLPEQTNLNK